MYKSILVVPQCKTSDDIGDLRRMPVANRRRPRQALSQRGAPTPRGTGLTPKVEQPTFSTCPGLNQPHPNSRYASAPESLCSRD